MAEKKVTIDQGEDKTFRIYLFGSNSRPFDLTNYDKFALAFPSTSEITPLVLTEVANANGSSINKTAPNVLGELLVTIDRIDTPAIKSGFAQDAYLEIENSVAEIRKRIKIPAFLDVEETTLPTP